MKMSDSDMKEARALFMRYGGDFFGVGREDDLERYEKYKVPAALEQEWLAEYRQQVMVKLEKCPTDADTVYDFCNTIRDSWDLEAIGPLIAFVRDSIGRLDRLHVPGKR